LQTAGPVAAVAGRDPPDAQAVSKSEIV